MNRKFAIIAGLVAVAILGAWYIALWKPATHSVNAARQQLATANNDQFVASLQRSNLLAKEKQLPAESAVAATLDQAAPATPDIPGLIDQVTAVAAASGVTWQSESTQGTAGSTSTPSASTSASSAPPGGMTSLTLSLSVTGTYNQLLDFVSRLQAAPRLIKVTSMDLTGSNASGAAAGTPSGPVTSGGGVMTTQISATMYQAPTSLPAQPRLAH